MMAKNCWFCPLTFAMGGEGRERETWR